MFTLIKNNILVLVLILILIELGNVKLYVWYGLQLF